MVWRPCHSCEHALPVSELIPCCARALSHAPRLMLMTDCQSQFLRNWARVCNGDCSPGSLPECPPPSGAPADPVAVSSGIICSDFGPNASRLRPSFCAASGPQTPYHNGPIARCIDVKKQSRPGTCQWKNSSLKRRGKALQGEIANFDLLDHGRKRGAWQNEWETSAPA